MRPDKLSVESQFTELVGGPNHAVAPLIIPPDGGWGWVVVVVGLLGFCCVDGVVFCSFLFREPMSHEIKARQADFSYLMSLNTGFYFIGAILACSFGNHWGFRITMMIGGIISSLAYSSGYMLHDINYYFIFVGVIAGFGTGFIAVGASLPANFYFDKRRSIAVGIVACGSGLGGMVMPQIIKPFMTHFGWRNTFLFEGGIFAFLTLLGLLIRPLRPVLVIVSPSPSLTNLIRDNTHTSTFSAFSHLSTVLGPQPSTVRTIAKMITDDVSVINIKVNENVNPKMDARLQQLNQSRRNSLQMSASREWLSTITIAHEPLINPKQPWYKCGCCRSKYVNMPARPLLRNDLYYRGNLKRLPEYTEKEKELEYHMDVTRVPTYEQTIKDLSKPCTAWCCQNIFIGLRYLVDYRLFKYLSFNCLALCGFGFYVAYYLPYNFCKVHLEKIGAGDAASDLVSFIGFGILVGRFLSGIILTACPKVDARSTVSLTTFIGGVSIVSMVLHDDLYYKTVCLFIFGFNIGFYFPLRSLIIVDYFGLDKLTSCTGVIILCVAFGTFIGAPLAEAAMNYTEDVNAPFYVCGIGFLVASVSLVPMKRLRKWELKRAEIKRTQESHS